MSIQQELRRAGKTVRPVIYSGAAAAWKLCGEARMRLEQSVRDRIARRRQPEMVYLSVPGWGTEEEIRLAMKAARSVYESGRIPVCPCMMFPSGGTCPADGRQTDRKMRFRLMDTCQSFLICGQRWTDEMWAEINHAITRGMEIKTDQGVGGRPAARLCLPAPRQTREVS